MPRSWRYFGAVAEWLIATVLKTVVPQGTEGSNPSCSVELKDALQVVNVRAAIFAGRYNCGGESKLKMVLFD